MKSLTTFTPENEIAPQCTYRPEYCELLIKSMAKGYSFEAVAGDLKISRQTLYNWCAMFPEFKEAKAIGTEISRKVLERNLLRDAKKGSTIASIFLLKNRFPNEWRDRKDIEAPKEDIRETLSLDEQIERVEAMRSHLLSIKSGQNVN